MSSAEARPEPSQATKINLFARIVNVFRLTLLFLSKVLSWMFEGLWLHFWPITTQTIGKVFPTPWVDKAILTPSDI